MNYRHDLSKKPYLVNAIIGNSHMLASASRTGRMYRLWWPHIDFPQHLDELLTGIRFQGDGKTTWFDLPEDNWQAKAAYVPGSNILSTALTKPDHPLLVNASLFAVPGENMLIRHYQLKNTGTEPISFDFIQYSSFIIAESPYYQTTQFDEAADALIHFRADYAFALSASIPCAEFQAGHARSNAEIGSLNGKEIEMVKDGALLWRFEDVQPGNAVELTLYLAAGHSCHDAVHTLSEARAQSYDSLYQETLEYWQAYLQAAKPCPMEAEPIRTLYERSLLVMKLMSDEQTGAVIAAPEFDETFSRCGGYSFCWGRDAAFITSAMDKAGLHELSARFYQWALTAQDESGAWQQRHYHHGKLAPSWGLQLDEGASILWGMWQHYQHTGNEWIISDEVWPAIEKGARFLLSQLDPETGLPLPSYDLWEERVAEHTYTAAAVYGGLTAAAEIAVLRGDHTLAQSLRDGALRIKQGIEASCWNDEKHCFYRGLKLSVSREHYERAIASGASGSTVQKAKGYTQYVLDVDPIIDVSLLGVSMPFAVLPPEDERMAQTADRIMGSLWNKEVGGIKRYEDDIYAGGNPWILTTLWLCHYRLSQGQTEEARRLLDWAIQHQTDLGLLPEQVDKVTGDTAWVVPLTWSHAMFVLAVWMLAESE